MLFCPTDPVGLTIRLIVIIGRTIPGLEIRFDSRSRPPAN